MRCGNTNLIKKSSSCVLMRVTLSFIWKRWTASNIDFYYNVLYYIKDIEIRNKWMTLIKE